MTLMSLHSESLWNVNLDFSLQEVDVDCVVFSNGLAVRVGVEYVANLGSLGEARVWHNVRDVVVALIGKAGKH